MVDLGILHVAFALAALASGGTVAMMRKGTRRHRQLGWVYAASMLGVNVTALLIYRLLGHFGPFHVAAIISLVSLAGGLIPVRRRRPQRTWAAHHAYWMAWSYVGLLAAVAAETLSRVPASPFWGMVGLASGLVFLGGKLVIDRTVPPLVARYLR